MYEKILVAVDISQRNEMIIKKAIEFAKKFDAELVICHIIPLAIADATFESGLSNVYSSEDDGDVIKSLTKFKDSALACGVKKVEIVVESSTNISYTINHDIYDKVKFDLAVIGSAHGTGIEKILLGSNAKNIMKNCKTDIFVVKSRGK